jgi:hydroxymethylglutaryl-CoA lyase
MPAEPIAWVECPRDAWQGLDRFISTERKRSHLDRLLAAGFRRLDLGSFVSKRAVPQLADTEAVLEGLDRPPNADFLCIVGNLRGIERAGAARGVTSVGYPLSVNETFQRRNLGRSIDESFDELNALATAARKRRLELVVYLSMGFGNPYGDPWTPEDTAVAWSRVRKLGVERVALADTAGTAGPEAIAAVLAALGSPDAPVGLHLHARPDGWQALVQAGLAGGVRWFEGALGGIGGCPFAGDALVGNLPTERVVPFLHARGFDTGIETQALGDLGLDATTLAAHHA